MRLVALSVLYRSVGKATEKEPLYPQRSLFYPSKNVPMVSQGYPKNDPPDDFQRHRTAQNSEKTSRKNSSQIPPNPSSGYGERTNQASSSATGSMNQHRPQSCAGRCKTKAFGLGVQRIAIQTRTHTCTHKDSLYIYICYHYLIS